MHCLHFCFWKRENILQWLHRKKTVHIWDVKLPWGFCVLPWQREIRVKTMILTKKQWDLAGLTFKFSELDFSTIFCRGNVNKISFHCVKSVRIWSYLVRRITRNADSFYDSLRYKNFITVKTITLCKLNFALFIKSRKIKQKKLALSSFYHLDREIWLSDS